MTNCVNILGEPSTGDRCGGETLLDHYWHVNSLSQSMKYSTRARDKHYTARLQRATQMVALLKEDIGEHLQIIDECNMEFIIRSQTNSTVSYALSLSTECCECEDRVAICKHLLAVRMLLDGQLQHLKKFLSSEEQLFYHELHEDGTPSSPRSSDSTNTLSQSPIEWSPPPNTSFEGIL